MERITMKEVEKWQALGRQSVKEHGDDYRAELHYRIYGGFGLSEYIGRDYGIKGDPDEEFRIPFEFNYSLPASERKTDLANRTKKIIDPINKAIDKHNGIE